MAIEDVHGGVFPVGANGPTGMTLRDWFAGQAINGFLSGEWGERCAQALNEYENAFPITLSAFAYAVADAMLAAREPKP